MKWLKALNVLNVVALISLWHGGKNQQKTKRLIVLIANAILASIPGKISATMRKTIKKKIKQYALETFQKYWGCRFKEYYNDLKKHYNLTGEIGFYLKEI